MGWFKAENGRKMAGLTCLGRGARAGHRYIIIFQLGGACLHAFHFFRLSVKEANCPCAVSVALLSAELSALCACPEEHNVSALYELVIGNLILKNACVRRGWEIVVLGLFGSELQYSSIENKNKKQHDLQ